MASWLCCVLLFCLLFPLKIEADDKEWKEEMEKQMKKVLAIVEEQNQVIKEQDLKIRRQDSKIRRQDSEIETLKKRVGVLETMDTMREEIETTLASSIRETEVNISHIVKTLDKQGVSKADRQKRLLIGNEGRAVAFYAYISTDFTLVGKNHEIVFDKVVTNSGHAYNNYSGTFTAPSSGLYAFSYTIAVGGHHMPGDHDTSFGEISVRLVRNGTPCGSIAADTESSGDDEMSTGFAILFLDAGDIVRVISQGPSQGTLLSNYIEYWTFSGFKISN